MSNRISILLQRNLDVFDENDPARRRALIDEYYTEDCVFYDPNNGSYRGRDEIAVESDGYRVCQVRLRLTQELTSSLPGKVA